MRHQGCTAGALGSVGTPWLRGANLVRAGVADDLDESIHVLVIAELYEKLGGCTWAAKPTVANENSVEGLYQSIAFFGAALEYYMRTGKTEPLREYTIDKSELKNLVEPESGTVGEKLIKGEAWMHDASVVITMLTPQPEREGDTYNWNIRLTMDPGEFIASKDRVQEAPSEAERKDEVERTLHGVYENGAWKLTGMRAYSSSSSSASASSSSSDS